MNPVRVAALLLSLAAADAVAAPQHIHLSWKGATDTSVVVTWRSTESSGTVEYGTTTAYGQTKAAASKAYAGSYLHVAELTGLSAATDYHYRCGASGSWSADTAFRTALPVGSSTPFRMAAFGDTRTNDTARAQVRSAMQARSPLFSIVVGDLVDTGSTQSLWDQWFTTMQPFASVAPLMNVPGNHEGNASIYYEQFVFPVHSPSNADYQDEAYYSFDYGNTHFVALSTEPTSTSSGVQRTWLEADLQRASQDSRIRWIIAFAHRPPYSSGSHGSDTTVRSQWAPLFEQYGVAVTFWGHDHHYERTWPLLGNQVVTSSGSTYYRPASNPAVVYVVTGGGGAPLYSAPGDWWTAFVKTTYEFVELNIDNDKIQMDTRDTSGAIIDSYTIARAVSTPCSDGTLDGQCSATKPKLCRAGALVDGCASCGCPDAGEICQGSGACAQPPRYVAQGLAEPPPTDGVLAEYAQLPAIALTGRSATGSAQVRAGWDVNALYLAYEVADDQLVPAPAGEGNMWDGDGVEVMIDTANDRSATADLNDYHLLVGVGGTLGDSRGWTDFGFTSGAAQVANVAGATLPGPSSGGGYRVELKVPWSAMGVTPRAGMVFGFDVAFSDKDPSGPIVYQDFGGLTSFNNPAGWGVLELGELPVQRPDAGMRPDADGAPTDAAEAPPDAAAEAVDSGVMEPDAGNAAADASHPGAAVDASSEDDVPAVRDAQSGYCGCSSSGAAGAGGLLALAAWLLGAARRKERP